MSASALSAAQRRALAHVDEMTRNIEAHNARWPKDKQTPGAYAGTAYLRAGTVTKLVTLGLLVEVESWPRHRCRGKYALTDDGRAALRSAPPTNNQTTRDERGEE